MKRGFLTGIIVRTPLALLGAALLLGSCHVREDRSDCPPAPTYNTRLLVTTDYEDEGQRSRGPADYNWYDNQIQSVTVYAFNEEDICVAWWMGGAYTVGMDYLVPMQLEQDGNYHFVAWTNSGNVYTPSHIGDEVLGLPHSELSMTLNIPANDDILREDIPHRHQGVLENAMIASDQTNEHTIVISPHTYKVNFYVRGLDGETGQYEIEVTDCNFEHLIDASHMPEEEDAHYHHRRELVMDIPSKDLEASMILLQIGDDTQTSFDVMDLTAGRSIYTADLLQTIQRGYSLSDAELAEMLEDVYEYDIIITFTGGGTGGALSAEVEVKAWGYKPNPIEL